MSRTDFLKLASPPELQPTLQQLNGWLQGHPYESFLDPRRLTRELRSLSPIAISTALTFLALQGAVKPAFKVIAPNHVFADPVFDSVDEITKSGIIYDTDHDPFDPKNADVVQVFLLPENA